MLNASGPCVWTEGAALTVGSSLDARHHGKHLHRVCSLKPTAPRGWVQSFETGLHTVGSQPPEPASPPPADTCPALVTLFPFGVAPPHTLSFRKQGADSGGRAGR